MSNELIDPEFDKKMTEFMADMLPLLEQVNELCISHGFDFEAGIILIGPSPSSSTLFSFMDAKSGPDRMIAALEHLKGRHFKTIDHEEAEFNRITRRMGEG